MTDKEIKEIGDQLTIRVDQEVQTKFRLNPKAKGLAALDQAKSMISNRFHDVTHSVQRQLNQILSERGINLSDGDKQKLVSGLNPRITGLVAKHCKF